MTSTTTTNPPAAVPPPPTQPSLQDRNSTGRPLHDPEDAASLPSTPVAAGEIAVEEEKKKKIESPPSSSGIISHASTEPLPRASSSSSSSFVQGPPSATKANNNNNNNNKKMDHHPTPKRRPPQKSLSLDLGELPELLMETPPTGAVLEVTHPHASLGPAPPLTHNFSSAAPATSSSSSNSNNNIPQNKNLPSTTTNYHLAPPTHTTATTSTTTSSSSNKPAAARKVLTAAGRPFRLGRRWSSVTSSSSSATTPLAPNSTSLSSTLTPTRGGARATSSSNSPAATGFYYGSLAPRSTSRGTTSQSTYLPALGRTTEGVEKVPLLHQQQQPQPPSVMIHQDGNRRRQWAPPLPPPSSPYPATLSSPPPPYHNDDDEDDHYYHHHQSQQVIQRMERALRQVGFLLLAYGAGVRYASWSWWVLKLAEYAAVAWMTCLILMTATAVQRRRALAQALRLAHQAPVDQREAPVPMPPPHPVMDDEEEQRPLLMTTDKELVLPPSRDLEAADYEPPPPRDAPPPVETVALDHVVEPQIHPSLEPYFVMEHATGQRIRPNAVHQPYVLDNDYLYGHMVALIRTPDVDDPTVPSTAANASAVQYLTSKQRRFEFQFQVRLKKVPTGRVYFACELHEPVRLGMIQRAFVSAAMAFVKATNSSFHYSMTGSADATSGVANSSHGSTDGRFEKPHMAFPVEEGMNRLVATPPGETPPVLGQEISEEADSIKRRKKGQLRFAWNLQDTYTMSLWSAYVDFIEWRCVQLPGIRPFALTNVIGSQPIDLVIYEIPPTSDKHYRSDLTFVSKLEMCNIAESEAGPFTRQWLERHKEGSRLQMTTKEAEIDPQSVRGAVDDMLLIAEDTEEAVAENPDEVAAAELGEGLYVRSGDSITLREFIESENEEGNQSSSSFVTNGGGFAILQEQSAAVIIIEKAGISRSRKNTASSRLIKSGDTVSFKLVTKSRTSDETESTRYLSIHRGWWLKWVAMAPTKNGFFTIYTHEIEYGEPGGLALRSSETQSSYLSLGGSFWLKHKKWSKFMVGVAAEGSATYGGRLLGLYLPKNASPAFPDDPNEQFEDDARLEQPDSGEKGKGEWMRPLRLQVYDSTAVGSGLSSRPSTDDLEEEMVLDAQPGLVFTREDSHMDVPAWLEIMNRTERIQQLVYAVRVMHRNPEEESDSFTRLRTGRDLAQIMRIGVNWRNSSSSPRIKKQHDADISATSPSSSRPVAGGEFSRAPKLDRATSEPVAHTNEEVDGGSREASDGEWDAESMDEVELIDDNEEMAEGNTSGSSAVRQVKSRNIIGKLAHSVKTRTTTTGKKVVQQSVKVGKGTVSAGKAIIAPIRPKNPPSREPKSAKKDSRRRQERDLHVAVSNKAIKRLQRNENRYPLLDSPAVLAGELSAPEQSCRTVSNMLSKMSSLAPSNPLSSNFSDLLASQVETPIMQDRWFLQGGAVEVGVVPSKGDLDKGSIAHDCLVARCMWESHWREEWCGVYEKGVAFYAPLTRLPCLELSFEDISLVRALDVGERSPLPGFPILVLETAWLCQYMAFRTEDARKQFHEKVEAAILASGQQKDTVKGLRENELKRARFWQGFQNAMVSSQTSGRDKWAEVSSGSKSKSRVVFNKRRMVFDIDNDVDDWEEFIEDMLATSLSFSLGSLEEHPEKLVKFLDSTSRLRTLNLDAIDRASKSAFCLFLNLYHCLLQHAMLLSVSGPLSKRSFGHFMRTSCYEIGGDVFSLAELQCCVIRGNMSKPIGPKPPYVEISKKSSAHRFYALKFTTPRVNFVLSTGDLSCPAEIPVLTAQDLDTQLNVQVAVFIRKNLTVDVQKRLCVIPKICEVYRGDFTNDAAGSANACLRYCLKYADESTASKAYSLLQEDTPFVIRYQPASEQFHSSLRRRKLDDEAQC